MVTKETISKIPKVPGVYIYKDTSGKVIYVGKANSLRSRVGQYFQSAKNQDSKTRALVKNIDDLEYITTGSEMEAFILESNLIKKHQPQYNILLRDDKTYPYIRITTSELFPRILKERNEQKGNDKYFGPYTDVGSVNQMIDFLNKVFALKRCKATNFPANFRPCLNYHIGQCEGPCIGKITQNDYKKKIQDIIDFLKGRNKKIDHFLKQKMEAASLQFKFEEAARYRDYLSSAKAIREKQRVVLQKEGDLDVVIKGKAGKVTVFSVIEGKLIDRETYNMESQEEPTEKETVSEFIRQHYTKQNKGPSQIIVEKEEYIDPLLEKYIEGIWEKSVKIFTPQKGEKLALLKLAVQDMEEQNKTVEARERREEEKEARLAEALSVVGQSKVKPRVEAFDISNIGGVDAVGAMIVFKGLKPEKKNYRKFKVITTEEKNSGPNDYASMQEVVFRRIKRGLDNDKSFLPMPDIMLIDGGKGHIQSVAKVLETLMPDYKKTIALVGMAKDKKHRTSKLVFWKNEGIEEHNLAEDKTLFGYIGRIQEEVHRFAITYHRNVRNKNMTKSQLEEIPGIGPQKRNVILNHFGTIDNLKKTTEEEIAKVRGLSPRDGNEIIRFFGITKK